MASISIAAVALMMLTGCASGPSHDEKMQEGNQQIIENANQLCELEGYRRGTMEHLRCRSYAIDLVSETVRKVGPELAPALYQFCEDHEPGRLDHLRCMHEAAHLASQTAKQLTR